MVLPQRLALFGERDVSRLQLLQQPLALVEPEQRSTCYIPEQSLRIIVLKPEKLFKSAHFKFKLSEKYICC